MSDTVRYKGIIVKVELKNSETYDNFAKRILEEKGYKLSLFDKEHRSEKYAEILADYFHKEYMYLNKILYKIIECNQEPYDDYINIIKVNDKIYFDACFYNGGTCLEELLEEKLSDE